MLDLYISCWIFSSIFFIGYILVRRDEIEAINVPFDLDFLKAVLGFYFMSFFTWHMLVALLVTDPKGFDNEIKKSIQNNPITTK